MLTEVVIFLFLLLCIFVKYGQKPSYLPPGKWGWPVIGYLPSKGEGILDMVKRLHAEYGKIFCVRMGAKLFVFLSDFEVIKSSLAKDEFSGRSDIFSFRILHYFENAGIVLANERVWSTNRKFALRVLKDFGMGKSILEMKVNMEVESLVKDFKTKLDQPCKIDWSLNVAVLNVMWGLVADSRFDINSKEIHIFAELVEAIASGVDGPSKIFNIYPWLIPYLRNIASNILKIDEFESNRDQFVSYFKKIIKEHYEALNENNPRDYIDMYLVEMKEQKDYSLASDSHEYANLIACVLDLFIAGSETTSSTIRWYILYMMKYPEVQKKIQEEIDSVVPKERYPSLEDKAKLPYFEASIYESLRLSSLIPLALPHCALEDSEIEGFKIPKGTIISPCIEICHRSSEYWERPNDYYPEHFINEEGKFYIRKHGFLPFALGRRMCLGDSLAKMELFLFLGAILQNFTISVPKGQTVNTEPDPIGSTINFPRKSEVLFRERNML